MQPAEGARVGPILGGGHLRPSRARSSVSTRGQRQPWGQPLPVDLADAQHTKPARWLRRRVRCGPRRGRSRSGRRPASQATAESSTGSQPVEVGEAVSLENTSTMGWSSAEALLQPLDLELLVPQHEGDDDARLAGAGGAARAVQVRLVVLGRVVVDDDVDVVDVDAAGGDVGGHQHGQLAGARSRASAFSRRLLAQVAVDGGGLARPPLELRGEAVGAPLGARRTSSCG